MRPAPCAITLSEGPSTDPVSVRPVRIARVFRQQSALIEIGVGAAAILTLLIYVVGRRPAGPG